MLEHSYEIYSTMKAFLFSSHTPHLCTPSLSTPPPHPGTRIIGI